jgi:hypothetical protein
MLLIITNVKITLFNECLIFFIGFKFKVHTKSNVNKYCNLEGVLVHRLELIIDLKIVIFYKVSM